MTSAPEKPLVFISASHRDASWRDRLKARLERNGQTEWWDDSRIDPGSKWGDEIDSVIGRARVAVVLLSPDYLASKFAIPELRVLARHGVERRLRLFPVVVRPCAWQELPELRDVQVWGMGRALDLLAPTEAEVELENIASDVARLAVETSREVAPEFRFSAGCLGVLERARSLAEQSGRSRVTSSCILFALARSADELDNTARFVRDALDAKGRYKEAFATFIEDSADVNDGTAPGIAPLGRVSSNVLALIAEAGDIAEKTTRKSREIHSRHLFASLLVGSPRHGEPHARRRMRDIGIDISGLRHAFLGFLRSTSVADDLDWWENILVGRTTTAGTTAAPSAAAALDPYTSGPVGYTPEFCRVGGSPHVADQLGVEPAAHRLAELIALRETKLPLAIGLFGNWGSGKSHFMNLIDRRLREVAHEGDGNGPWCREIVPVYFNAWHYLDSNLWASLVTEIFDGLFKHLQPKEDALQQVHSQLQSAGGAAALAQEEVTQARAAVQAASSALTDARARSESAHRVFNGLLDNLRLLLPQMASAENRDRVHKWLGVAPEVATLSQLVEKHRELSSAPGQVRELWQWITNPQGRWWRVGWVAGALVITPWLVQLATDSMPLAQRLLARFGPAAQEVLAGAIALFTSLSPALLAAQRQLRDMKALRQQAEQALAARPRDPDITAARERLTQAEAMAAAAEARLADARTLEQQLTQAAEELRPERRLTRFIETRARSSDYRGQLGLVSLARRDFQELSDIFADQDALQAKLKGLSEEEKHKLRQLSASVDRIVLFVDDLDRCQPERVVDVLQAVHLLLAFPLFAVVVGVDQRCLRQSLRMQLRGLLTGDSGARPSDRLDDDADDERPATPLDYLEKIFHIPFHLPSMDDKGYVKLMEKLTRPSSPPPGTAAVGTPQLPTDDHAVKEPDVVPHTPSVADTHAPAILERADMREAAEATTIASVPLYQWERTALSAYHPLVRTPRAATRLLNTYRLVRGGIPAGEWPTYCGDQVVNGEFRIAMLLLAAAAGYPAFAREWFNVLRTRDSVDDMESSREPDVAGWKQFKDVYSTTAAQMHTPPTKALVTKWIDRVEQFAF